MKLPSRQAGFTAIELIIVIIIATFLASLFFVQRNDARARAGDSIAKTHVNTLHYYLEDIYFPTKNAYPESLNPTLLKGLDPETFKDPQGNEINAKDGTLKYEGTNCNNGLCQGYKLSADLIKEQVYVKTNRAH